MEAEYKYDKLPDSEKSKIQFSKYEHDFGKVNSQNSRRLGSIFKIQENLH